MDNAGSGSFAATEEYSKLLMSAWRKVFNNAGKGSGFPFQGLVIFISDFLRPKVTKVA